MDPERWLNNFKPEEMDHATQLLYSFLYYSERLSDEMFIAAVVQTKSNKNSIDD
jgi:cob(I)alamin adenosyltransferase